VGHAYTLLVVVVGFVIFRAESLAQAGDFLAAMVGFARGDGLVEHVGLYLRANVALTLAVAVAGAAPLLPWLGRRLGEWALGTGGLPARVLVRSVAVAGVTALLLLTGMSLAAGTHNPFIYFRF
jgi:alginate O-acetyltransferase complex protein AlgI